MRSRRKRPTRPVCCSIANSRGSRALSLPALGGLAPCHNVLVWDSEAASIESGRVAWPCSGRLPKSCWGRFTENILRRAQISPRIFAGIR